MWVFSSALFLALNFLSGTQSVNAQSGPPGTSLGQELKSLESKIDNLAKTASVKTSVPSVGEWIGRFVVDEASAEYCNLKIDEFTNDANLQIFEFAHW